MNLNIFIAIPEIFLSIMIVFLLLLDAFLTKCKSTYISLVVAITLIITVVLQLYVKSNLLNSLAFNNMFVLDNLAQGSKLLLDIFALLIMVFIARYLKDKAVPIGEYYAIVLFAILGMDIMISGANFIVLYLGLEIYSLASVGLLALNRDSAKSSEAALKYFILSSLASGILLYGISFIYGVTQQFDLHTISLMITQLGLVHNSLAIFGVVLILVGLSFKLGLVPFHMWIPDSYEGGTLSFVIIIGTIAKLAGVVLIIRILQYTLHEFAIQWSDMLVYLALLSLFLGNIVAISQTNIKRMLGYSTIAHMGFIALGLSVASHDGLLAVILYTITYLLTSIVVFGVLAVLSKDQLECENISDLTGLAKTNPLLSAIMLLAMFSLAGIPPLIGFYAKFMILSSMVQVSMFKTTIFAVIMSLIGAFYYLRIVKVMYFDKPKNDINTKFCLSHIFLYISGLLLLLLGVYPKIFIDLCNLLITGNYE